MVWCGIAHTRAQGGGTQGGRRGDGSDVTVKLDAVGGGRCGGTVVIKLIIAFRLHGQHVRVVQWV